VLADLWLRGPAVLAVQVTLRHGDNRDLALGVGAAEDLDRRLVAALGLNFVFAEMFFIASVEIIQVDFND